MKIFAATIKHQSCAKFMHGTNSYLADTWVGALSSGYGRRLIFQEVVGSNPDAIYWMDMTFFKLIRCKGSVVCLKTPKINEKESGVGKLKKPFDQRS